MIMLKFFIQIMKCSGRPQTFKHFYNIICNENCCIKLESGFLQSWKTWKYQIFIYFFFFSSHGNK